MHRKRKLLLATVALVLLLLAYLRRNSNTNNSTAYRNNRGLEVPIVLQPTECRREIVWLVHSSLANFESRNVIRESYSSQELDALGVVRIFVVGVDASYQHYFNGRSVGNRVGGLTDMNENHRNNVKRDVDGDTNTNVGSNTDADEKIKNLSNINSNGNVKNKLEINADVDTNSNNIFNNSTNSNTDANSNTHVSTNPSIKKRHIPVTTITNRQSLIMKEQERHGDLLQADFLDTYRNLTLKHITGLNYIITHCPKIFHIFKSDDDVIIDVPRILALIQRSFSDDSGNVRSDNDVGSNENFINNANSDVINSSSDTDRSINNNSDTNNNHTNIYQQNSSGDTNTSTATKTGTGTSVYRNSSQTILTDVKANAAALSHTSILNTLDSNSSTSTSVSFHTDLNIYGFKMTNKLVERNPSSKWFVTDEEYSGNYYPTFVSGWLYFTSKPVVDALLRNYIEYTKRKEEFWIDDVFVTGMLRDGLGVQVVGLNEMYAVDYRYLQCCVKDLSRNLHCDYAVGPDGAKKSLHKEFKEFLDFCRHRCRKRSKENSVKNTCIVAYDRDEDIGNGKPVIESV